MPKRSYAIYIEEDIYNKVKEVADEENRSFSQQINKILRDYLESLGRSS